MLSKSEKLGEDQISVKEHENTLPEIPAMACDDDLIFMSVGLYKFFMAHGKEGADAKVLYEHLMFTARMQGRRYAKANDFYLRNGLGWGVKKVKTAKAFLHKAKLIDYWQARNDKTGAFGDTFIIIRAFKAESVPQKQPEQEDEEPEKDDSTGGSISAAAANFAACGSQRYVPLGETN